jgi:ferredoxin
VAAFDERAQKHVTQGRVILNDQELQGITFPSSCGASYFRRA